jgi:hypothetical protein
MLQSACVVFFVYGCRSVLAAGKGFGMLIIPAMPLKCCLKMIKRRLKNPAFAGRQAVRFVAQVPAL